MAAKGIIVQIPDSMSGAQLKRDASQDIKFGVLSPMREGDKAGELIILTPSDPLSHACVTACQRWGYTDPSIFALKFSEPPGHYVTEATRKNLPGKLVFMVYSPSKVCEDIIGKLKQEAYYGPGLKDLSMKASDPTIAEIFVAEDGLKTLMEIIEKDKLGDKEQILQCAFQSLLDIIFNCSTATWEMIQGPVLTKIISYINSTKGVPSDRLALKSALQVLENAILSGTASEQIEKEVTLPTLIHHMTHPDRNVQQNVLSLINALLSRAESNRRKHLAASLNSKSYRTCVLNHVINKPGERPAETNHQLYVLQTLLLNLLHERKLTPVDPQDQQALNRIKDLCRIAFDSDSGFCNFNGNSDTGRKDKPNYSRDYRKLGFKNEVNPAQDFAVIPPGILALDCMHHLAHTHTETYTKLVIECAYRGSGDDFLLPFARASITLTTLLCDILRVGEPPGDQEGKFYPFFFQHEKAFEELFCICAHLAIKTWKEMRATVEDFDKVFDVIREQIRRALDTIPHDFAAFQNKLHGLTFNEITTLRAQERSSREEGELQAKPIQDLKKKVIPEIQGLIKQNRLNFLIAGTRFNKFASKGVSASANTLKRVKEKFWYCRLSPNEKTFHYGDCEEKITPMPESLSTKLPVIEIKDLLIGKDCPHMKESKKNRNWPFAFSLIQEREPLRSVDFIAPDEKTFDLWMDGINALLGKEMTSKEAKADLDILLHMEIKLRLLDIEGLTIPQEPPPIPPPPPNFDYAAFSSGSTK